MANKYLQTVLYRFREIFGVEVGVIDDGGYLFSTSSPSRLESEVDTVLSLASNADGPFTYNGYTVIAESAGRGAASIICFVEGEDAGAKRDCEVMLAAVLGMKQFHDEKFDKANFVKNIILDNILPGDIYAKTKEMHLAYDVKRAVFLVRNAAPGGDFEVFDVIMSMFPDNGKDFVINIDKNNIAIIKELRAGASLEDLEKIASSIFDTLQAEAMVTASIGIGTVVLNIRDLAKSYKEAQVALEVGKVFDTEKNIISYENLGIGRLIYQLPTTLCELFLSEVFKKDSIDSLDHETITTIQKFFENNLNVSETARQLYVHRNTLVYRLDKVQKITGLDLRIFDHAIVFKVAMMVKKYLVTNPVKM